MLALVACSALLVAGLEGPPADVTRTYQEAKAKAGRSPEEQVRLALWCESRGLTAQRLHHLTLAVLADPSNMMARGLMGLVLHDGRWQRPEALADKAKADPVLAEYGSKRLKAAYTADAQYALGVWCEEHGLKEQAKASLTAVIRLDPKRENAWKKLGYRKHEGRWATDAQLAAEKADAEAQKLADRKWKPLLEKYKAMLDQPSRREEAEAALASVTDPRAVASIRRVFATVEALQPRAAQLFGQIESPAASRALASLAIFARSAEARRVATEILRGRDPRQFLGLLIDLIRDPIKYEVRPVGGPGSPGVLYVEGKQANIRRVYAPPPPPSIALLPGDSIAYDNDGLPVVVRFGMPSSRVTKSTGYRFSAAQYTGQAPVSAGGQKVIDEAVAATGQTYADLLAIQEKNGLGRGFDRRGVLLRGESNIRGGPVTVVVNESTIEQVEIDIPIGRMMVESQKTALVAQQQLAEDARSIDRVNDGIKDLNGRARGVLNSIIGQDLGDDREAWNRMWVNRQGYVYRMTSTAPTPTFVEDVPLDYQPAPISPVVGVNSIAAGTSVTASLRPAHSCFAAGTTVRTVNGDRPIETIRMGDLVLVQDTGSGALGYQGVVAAYHNPPSPTLRIKLGGDEAVVATGIHRFWKAGKGWTMARDLKAGDLVRTLGGVAKVESVADDRIQPVFNLEVAEGHSFLVGKLGALVHDNSEVEATPAPFDGGSNPPLAVAKSAK